MRYDEQIDALDAVTSEVWDDIGPVETTHIHDHRDIGVDEEHRIALPDIKDMDG
jgi:hypothetical protein